MAEGGFERGHIYQLLVFHKVKGSENCRKLKWEIWVSLKQSGRSFKYSLRGSYLRKNFLASLKEQLTYLLPFKHVRVYLFNKELLKEIMGKDKDT